MTKFVVLMQRLSEAIRMAIPQHLRAFGAAASSGPRVTSVYDKVVSFFLVDEHGKRNKVTCMEGDSLAMTCAKFVESQNIQEELPGQKDFHVILPQEWVEGLDAYSGYSQVRYCITKSRLFDRSSYFLMDA